MNDWVIDHVLSAIILLPGLAAFLMMIFNALISWLNPAWSLPERLWWWGALIATGTVFGLAFSELFFGFDPEAFGPQRVEVNSWISVGGVLWFVGVDGISLFLVLLTTATVPWVLLTARRQLQRDPRSFVFCVLLSETGVLGVFLALDAALLLLAWQLTLLPLFLILGRWGGPRRARAAIRFSIAWGLGSMLILWALGVVSTGDSLALYGLPGLEEVGLLERGGFQGDTVSQGWVLAALLLGLALTIPIFPLHAWFSDVDREAPLALSLFLNAVGLKIGTYLLMRLVIPLCPDALESVQVELLFCAGIVMVYAFLLMSAQDDFRRLVAWWTLAQLALISVGIFSMEVRGLTGAVMAMMSHGFTSIALFLLIEDIFERRKTLALSELGGLARPMPVFSFFLAVVVFCAMGLPPLIGFIGQLMIFLGSNSIHWGIGFLILVGWGIGSGGLARFYRRIALGPVSQPENRGLIDLRFRERLSLFLVLIPIVWIGIAPGPLLRRIEPSVLELLRFVEVESVDRAIFSRRDRANIQNRPDEAGRRRPV